MATPNYSYEKRQRELAKKRKQEEKRQKKVHRSEDQATDAPDEPGLRADAAPSGEALDRPDTET